MNGEQRTHRLLHAALGTFTLLAIYPILWVLTLAFSGALLQAGMGLMTYAEMADRLDVVVAVIMRGSR